MSPIACRPLLAVLTLALAACSVARGQSVEFDDPFNQETARRMYEGSRAEPQALRQELREAARAACLTRLRRAKAGADYPDLVLDDLAKLLAADLTLAKTPGDRRAARERYWAGCREVELLTLQGVEVGIKQFTIADYWAARTERLLAELRLVGELGADRAPPASLLNGLDDADPLASGAARDEFEATRAEPGRLAQAARDACTNEYGARVQRIMAGTDTPNLILPIVTRRLMTTLAAGESPAEYLAAAEAVWLLSRKIEQLTEQRVEAGIKVFTTADFYGARDCRLEANVLMVEGRRGTGKLLPLQGALQSPFAAVPDPLDTKAVARAKAESVRADVRDLNRQRRQTILAEYEQRIQRIRAGTDTPDVTSVASRRLLDVEVALAGGKAESIAAWKRYRARAAEIEGLTRERVEAGIRQFTQADVWDARYDRILAELRLAEARAAKE